MNSGPHLSTDLPNFGYSVSTYVAMNGHNNSPELNEGCLSKMETGPPCNLNLAKSFVIHSFIYSGAVS